MTGEASCKGYHSRETLKSLDDGPWKTRIAEPKRDGFLRWHGDDEARRAVVNNRARLLSGVARAAFKLRAEVAALVAELRGLGWVPVPTPVRKGVTP